MEGYERDLGPAPEAHPDIVGTGLEQPADAVYLGRFDGSQFRVRLGTSQLSSSFRQILATMGEEEKTDSSTNQ